MTFLTRLTVIFSVFKPTSPSETLILEWGKGKISGLNLWSKTPWEGFSFLIVGAGNNGKHILQENTFYQ